MAIFGFPQEKKYNPKIGLCINRIIPGITSSRGGVDGHAVSINAAEAAREYPVAPLGFAWSYRAAGIKPGPREAIPAVAS
jgi:hypothetical protein